MLTDRRGAPISVAIVNDYPIVIEGLVAMFERLPDRFVVRHHGTGRSDPAEELGELPLVDLVLLDPFASGTVLNRRLPNLRQPGQGKVVILSWYRTDAAVEDAAAHGCAGFLSKTLDPATLADALDEIAREAPDTMTTTPWPASNPRGQWPGRQFGLTARESEVLLLIAEGMTNKDIAAHLYIGSESLKTHIRAAYRKIGVGRRSQAIVWCLTNGLASPT